MRARKAAERMVESKFKDEVTRQKQKLKEVKLRQYCRFYRKIIFLPPPLLLKKKICPEVIYGCPERTFLNAEFGEINYF